MTENFDPREEKIASLLQRPASHNRVLLAERTARLARLVELEGPEIIINIEMQMIAEVKEALRRRGEEPVIHS